MYSIIEPIEVSLLKLFSDIFKTYGLKATFNYFEDEIEGYVDTKIQELGYRAFIEKVKQVGDKVFTMPQNVLMLYQRTTPLIKNPEYGTTGLPPKIRIYDEANKKVIEKGFFQAKWTYNFIVVCKSREFEEFLEFLFYQDIQFQKYLSFVLKINDYYAIPLSYKLNISEINEYGKLSEELIDNVYKYDFELEISGPIFSPFSLEMPFIESCKTEIIAVPPKDMTDPNKAISEGRYEMIGDFSCQKGLYTFNDTNDLQSFTKDKKEEKELKN